MADYRSLFDLTGANVVVTGAAHGGLGYYSALALADLGANVVVSDLTARSADLDETVSTLAGRTHGHSEAITCDITQEHDATELMRRAAESMGSVAVLIHHAGVMLRGPAVQTSLADWQRVLDVNLTGTWLINRAAATVMGAGGSIVNTSTVYAQIAGPIPESAYYASKAGIANLTRGLAMEWGPHGIRVNCLAPGVFYPTEMTAPLKNSPEQLDQMAARTMLGRLGDPEVDLVGAVAFLASSASRYVTGQVLYADGGWSAW
jgi:gluconate 5-dehydrogenase